MRVDEMFFLSVLYVLRLVAFRFASPFFFFFSFVVSAKRNADNLLRVLTTDHTQDASEGEKGKGFSVFLLQLYMHR